MTAAAGIGRDTNRRCGSRSGGLTLSPPTACIRNSVVKPQKPRSNSLRERNKG